MMHILQALNKKELCLTCDRLILKTLDHFSYAAFQLHFLTIYMHLVL